MYKYLKMKYEQFLMRHFDFICKQLAKTDMEWYPKFALNVEEQINNLELKILDLEERMISKDEEIFNLKAEMFMKDEEIFRMNEEIDKWLSDNDKEN